jgi:hypothetical protein
MEVGQGKIGAVAPKKKNFNDKIRKFYRLSISSTPHMSNYELSTWVHELIKSTLPLSFPWKRKYSHAMHWIVKLQ